MASTAATLTGLQAFWTAWSSAFVITIAVEISVCLQLLPQLDWRRVTGVAWLCSMLTHPVLWWTYSQSSMDYWNFVAIGELAVVLVEAGVLWSLLASDLREAVGLSLTMNAASYLVGLLLLG